MKSWLVFALGVFIMWLATFPYVYYSFGNWQWYGAVLLAAVGLGLCRISGWMAGRVSLHGTGLKDKSNGRGGA